MGQPASPIAPMPEKKSGAGFAVALAIILLLLLAGGYFLMGRAGQGMRGGDRMMAPGTGMENASADTGMMMADPNTVQGDSIEISDIEADLNATDLESLEADLNAI